MAHPAVFRAASKYALEHNPSVETVSDIFASQYCPVSMLISYKSLTQKLFEHLQGSAARAVASNSRTPQRTLRAFLKGDNIARYALAGSKHTPEEMQWELARDPIASVRMRLAECCGQDAILDYLAGDAEVRIRAEVARNTRTNKKTLRRLLKDAKASVRARAMANRRTSLQDIRIAARKETSPAAIANALNRLGVSEQEVALRAAKHPSPHARKMGAATILNPHVLDGLVWDSNRGVRQAAAQNSAASEVAQVAVYLQSVAERAEWASATL